MWVGRKKHRCCWVYEKGNRVQIAFKISKINKIIAQLVNQWTSEWTHMSHVYKSKAALALGRRKLVLRKKYYRPLGCSFFKDWAEELPLNSVQKQQKIQLLYELFSVCTQRKWLQHIRSCLGLLLIPALF